MQSLYLMGEGSLVSNPDKGILALAFRANTMLEEPKEAAKQRGTIPHPTVDEWQAQL